MLAQESIAHERAARTRAFTRGRLIRPNHLRGTWFDTRFYILSTSLAGLAKRGLVLVLSPWIFWCSSVGPGSPGNPKQVFAALLGNVQRTQHSDFGGLPTVAPRLQQIGASTRHLQQESIGRKIPSNYLYELALDARALEMVAAAILAENVDPARPAPGRREVSMSGPGRTRPNASGVVRAGVQVAISPALTPSSPVFNPFEAFFLAPGSGRRGSGPDGMEPQVFAGAVLGAEQKARLTQMLDDVRLDLSDKVSFAGKNPSDPFTPVKIRVTTRDRLKQEVNGVEVWFAPKVLFEENQQYYRFERPSSPTDYPLPPGNYVFWTRSGSVQGPMKYCNDVGMDGLTERSVDPLFTP
jgi:hypothetical protein